MTQKTISRIERKKELTLRKIISTAVDLFNQKGLELVSMEAIAETADIAKGTLYNYFPSKEAIINAYLQRSFSDNNQERLALLRSLPDTRSRLKQVFTLLVEGIRRQPQIFEAFMVYRMKQIVSFRPVVETERTGLALLIHEIISLGQQSGELLSDLPEDLLSGLFEYALIAAIRPFYLQPENFDAAKSIEQSVEVFLNGASR